MKRTRTIYLVFTAIAFLLQQLVCLYRDCINNFTKTTLIACKLLSVGDYMILLIPKQAAGMVIIPPDNKVQTTVPYNSQEVQGKSKQNSHRMKTAVLPSVRAQKAHIQPETFVNRETAMLYVTMPTLMALWVYAVFRRNKHYFNSKNQGCFQVKQALFFDKMPTAL